MSFSIVNIAAPSQSHIDQHVLAIVNCPENYSNIKLTLAPLLNEISEINTRGEIAVDGNSFKLEIFVGGDMKFIQLILGLSSSIATYACPWCKVHKEDRGDFSLTPEHYHTPGMIRSIAEITELAHSATKQKFGVKENPLLQIDPHHYIPDELHLLMRITDVLLRNIIMDAKSKDDFGKITNQPTDNLALLVKAIQSCGLTFATWTSKNGDLDWTSLTGNDKKKLLEQLPDKLLFCLHEDTRDRVVCLWKQFETIYKRICAEPCPDAETPPLFDCIHTFMESFIEIGTLKREGYLRANVTPYMHALAYHVPHFVHLYGGLGKFSGQGVEKTNDVVKQIHRTKSNKLDATVDALLVRKRLEEHNRNKTRVKRTYTKVNATYWNGGIRKLRESKKKQILEEMHDAHSSYYKSNDQTVDYQSLSINDIKQKLSDLGVKTKLRKKEKLIELLQKHV